MNSVKALLREPWRRTSYLLRRFSHDRCSANAAALTYMSLFALVPLLTVMYTIASAIPDFQGAEQQMQSIVFEHLVPQSGAAIEQYVNDFSTQAKSLTGPGIAFLFITAVLMLRNIEKAFNLIWRARKNRNPLSSFLLYWAVLTLSPITIGLALALGTYLSSFAHTLADYDIFGMKAALLQMTPILLSTMGFSLIYAAVPNCRVPFKHALIGGIVAALAFQAARSLFTKMVVGSSYTFIYGAFAAVPLFLLWVYLSWNIVLMGGVLVHSLSAYQNTEQANRPLVIKALQILYVFWQKQQSGSALREIELLDGRYEATRGLDSETWGELRDIFLAKRVITQNDKGHYLLSRDLHALHFWQLKEWIENEPAVSGEDISAGHGWQGSASNLLLDQRKSQRELLNTTLVELFER